MKEEFNPSSRKPEAERRELVLKALKILWEADYLREEEWDKLKKLIDKSIERDSGRWRRERENEE